MRARPRAFARIFQLRKEFASFALANFWDMFAAALMATAGATAGPPLPQPPLPQLPQLPQGHHGSNGVTVAAAPAVPAPRLTPILTFLS